MSNLRRAMFLLIAFFLIQFSWVSPPLDLASAQTTENTRIIVLNRANKQIDQIIDGNTIRLRVENLQPANESQQVTFLLDSSIPSGNCEVSNGSSTCETPEIRTLGWYWDPNGVPKSDRQITVRVNGATIPDLITSIAVLPRPVVLVHGFISDYTAFTNYLGPDGYLAKVGLHGYAVGDGQVEGMMDTGSIEAPQKRTNTILQNANILGQYIQNVKSQTGAEIVDLVVHSMGGLISRAYIDQVMEDRDVAQLIMLGSPMGGTECSNLPAALGFYLPATIEIRPSYVRDIFNLQFTRRKGIPFYDLAGTSILEGFKSPCTDIPNDLVVSLESVNAIPIHSDLMPVLHTELNTSQLVFEDFVLPKLQIPAGSFKDDPDPVLSGQTFQPVQFTRMYTGFIKANEPTELAIQIDTGVSVASFALYDASRSLAVSVRGASGNEIELNSEQNGLRIVDDPSMLFYLGYGFNNPKAGEWFVRLDATERTPPNGTAYALTANFTGGPILEANATPLIPTIGADVTFIARLMSNDMPIEISSANASIRHPDATTSNINLEPHSEGYRTEWKPQQIGLHGIDVLVIGIDGTGQIVERTAYLAVDVLPGKSHTYWSLAAIGFFGLVFVSLVLAGIARIAMGRRNEQDSQIHGANNKQAGSGTKPGI